VRAKTLHRRKTDSRGIEIKRRNGARVETKMGDQFSRAHRVTSARSKDAGDAKKQRPVGRMDHGKERSKKKKRQADRTRYGQPRITTKCIRPSRKPQHEGGAVDMKCGAGVARGKKNYHRGKKGHEDGRARVSLSSIASTHCAF